MTFDWLSAAPPDLIQTFLSAILAYGCLILLVRLNGLRTFAKMSSFDFALTVAMGSVLASVVVSDKPPVLRGMVAFLSLVAIQRGVAEMRRRFSWWENLVDNRPLLLMDGPRVLEENMRKGRVTRADLRSKLREANVLSYQQVRAVVLETTGDISVLHSEDSEVDLHEDLLAGVRRE